MASLDLTERDLPIGIVGGTIALLMVPIAALLAGFAVGGPVSPGGIALTVGYVLVAGVIIASVCGYMAGLIGASNSPISGIGILAVLG
ncbi:oligopeptide transporter, OPT family, partial [Klebsiella pneumoniae]